MNDAYTIKIKSETAYIYVWISVKNSYIYVGETARIRYGVIGRAFEHIQYSDKKENWGTLRKNVYDKLEMNLEDIDDFFLLSFPLTKEKGFPDYMQSEMDRETVEYLVKNLWNIEFVKKYKKSCICESYAQFHNVEYGNKRNHTIAQQIVKECLDAYAQMI